MSVLPRTRSLSWHESHHAAALLALDWPPALVRIDKPTDEIGGLTRPDWERRELDEASMHDLLVTVMMGPLGEGARLEDWLLGAEAWPHGCGGDAKQVGFLISWLGIGTADFLHVCREVVSLARQPRFRRLVVEVAQALEASEVLFRDELIALAERTNA